MKKLFIHALLSSVIILSVTSSQLLASNFQADFTDSSTLIQELCKSECSHLSYGYRGISRNLCSERTLCLVRYWDDESEECVEDGVVRRTNSIECRDILPLPMY
ncbi:MAG: hypothetical protein HN353_05300 [Bdellovibrionales bacterium]|jgi:hypothetical protein|nr:hypothetical protein [Bdellovibrionales bacterium]MBT3526465.1 hypothetical protein [Bdellovibrionales bacterium]MBT7669362.1 hypothetical protein [Bdellovibrionales bacterium]MBT7767621.1 hypothetical protein [Bdellovibrionales bacterium]